MSERPWSATSRVLILHGPFAFSPNPMFLAGTITLLGWALFYGNVVILIVAVVGWTLSNSSRCHRRARSGGAPFGEPYRAYKARVHVGSACLSDESEPLRFKPMPLFADCLSFRRRAAWNSTYVERMVGSVSLV